MENHDGAYHVWRNAGIKNQVLVHIDAHHDMWWIDDNRNLTIANFICPALKENIVSEVYWVVPDRSLLDPSARRELLGQIRSVAREYRSPASAIQVHDEKIVVPLIDKRLTVTSLRRLELAEQPVLLDIDVDYLMIPQVAHDHADVHSELPWCWPAELTARIAEARFLPELITISYSVEGCYTPLAWKYLGEEVKSRLLGCVSLGAYDELRQGTIAAAQGDRETAAARYRAAAELMPESAAPHYHLALLALDAGEIDKARAESSRTLELDPAYATGFNTLGWHYFWQRRYVEAGTEFRRALTLNPGDAYALVGMARLAARRKQWNQALDWATRALGVSDDNLDAHRCIAEAYARVGQIDSAIRHCERSLQLGLHGHKALSWHILTCTQEEQFADGDHAAAYAELGRLRALQGDFARAIDCYRIAVAANFGGIGQRIRLAQLHLKCGHLGEAAAQMRAAAQQLPESVRKQVRRGIAALAAGVRKLGVHSRALA